MIQMANTTRESVREKQRHRLDRRPCNILSREKINEPSDRNNNKGG